MKDRLADLTTKYLTEQARRANSDRDRLTDLIELDTKANAEPERKTVITSLHILPTTLRRRVLKATAINTNHRLVMTEPIAFVDGDHWRTFRFDVPLFERSAIYDAVMQLKD